jgi:hypothetical protein
MARNDCNTSVGRVRCFRRSLQRTPRSMVAGIAVVVFAALLSSGCARDESGLSVISTDAPGAQVAAWETYGVCGEVFFWAATGDGTRAITVEAADGWDQSEELAMSFTLPDNSVSVKLVEGTNLDEYFCTDLPGADAKTADTVSLTTGSGEMRLDAPRAICLERSGQLSLSDLATQTGEVLPALEIDALGVGCTAG